MSKRFGRNQKRAMRQHIADSAEKIKRLQEAGQHNEYRVRLLNEILANFAEELGDTCALLGVPMKYTVHFMEDFMAQVPRNPARLTHDLRYATLGEVEVIHAEWMRLLDMTIVRDRLAPQMIMDVQIAGKRAMHTIALSDAALRNGNNQKYFDFIGREVARHLKRQFDKDGANHDQKARINQRTA